MRKSLILLTAITAGMPGVALAQTVSGGQAPQADGSIRSTDLSGNGSATSQYLQQRALNNLPGTQPTRISPNKLGPSRRAKPAELVAGAIVNDKTGAAIAKIAEVDPDGVVVSTGLKKVKIQAEAFGHNKAGLLLDTTKADFDKVIAQAK